MLNSKKLRETLKSSPQTLFQLLEHRRTDFGRSDPIDRKHLISLSIA